MNCRSFLAWIAAADMAKKLFEKNVLFDGSLDSSGETVALGREF